MEKVASVRLLPPVLDRFKVMRGAVDDADIDQLLSLVDWLIRHRELETAKAEVDRILERSPDHGPAKRTRELITTQMQLRDTSASTAAGAPAKVDPESQAIDPADAAGNVVTIPLLLPEQINLIKVFEIDLTRPPPISIPREAMARALEQFAGNPLVPPTREGRDAILRQTPIEQLNLLFQLKARDTYSQVKVQGTPDAMGKFRDAVLGGFIINSCATTACHGGLEAGRLVLMNRRPNSDATVYTDFYILENFRTGANKPLLDYDNPERSTLLQLGLPRADALVKHPVVPRGENNTDAWKPTFRSTTDRRYQETILWLKSMYRPRPDYQISYKPLRPFLPPALETPANASPGR